MLQILKGFREGLIDEIDVINIWSQILYMRIEIPSVGYLIGQL
jgi:hypothetical protein